MASITNYSPLDRLVHKLAFHSELLQEMLAGIENTLLSGEWVEALAERPIFITSLPRAGTTIMLEALYRLPGVATHTYRDMPFLLTPVLWNRFSAGMRRQSQKRERAHGDGLVVNEDSPEAFEEVLWRKYYRHKYARNGIGLWQAEDINVAFAQYFREHMKKIVAIRQPMRLSHSRYVSKNNGNIARVEALRAMFSDAYIVVPLRHPLEHAISLWRQHQNFIKQHATDPFVRKYMADIGHYEFGAIHRPIMFAGLAELTKELSPESISYWLAYWIAAFEHLAAQQGVDFVSYESLCTTGVEGLARLCRHLDIKAADEHLAAAASVFRAPPASRSHIDSISRDLTDQAMFLYNGLAKRCLLKS